MFSVVHMIPKIAYTRAHTRRARATSTRTDRAAIRGFMWWAPRVCGIYIAMVASFYTRAEMYDLSLPTKITPLACAHGCARWRSLEADGSPQPQHAADAMWKYGPPGETFCPSIWPK